VLWYTSESWALARKSESALVASERKISRRILGPMIESNTFRIRHDNESYKQFEKASISNNIKLKILQ
jgi:hypothetical protein